MARLTTQFQLFDSNTYNPSKFHEFLRKLEQLFSQIIVDNTISETVITAATYTVTRQDSLLLCDTTSNSIDITLDSITTELVKERREFTAVKLAAANTVTVYSTAPDTILGSTSVAFSVVNTSLTVRATTQGWVAI